MIIWMALGPNRINTPAPFKSGGTEAFESYWYWSSTEYAQYSYRAWIVGFFNGYQTNYLKHYKYGVRAVRRLRI